MISNLKGKSIRTFILFTVMILAVAYTVVISTNKEYKEQAISHLTISAMKENYYTHALWNIKEGKTEEFIAAWKQFGNALSQIPNSPPVQGTLIQSLADPQVFYSFGPWETLEDINAMRSDENVKKALSLILELCQEAKPGNYKTVLQLTFPGTRKQ